MGFEKFDDRVSSMEAPPSTGFFVDSSGGAWDSRPDNVIDKYMSKVSLTQDNYWTYRKYVNGRQWFELDMFLERLEKDAEGDSLIRIKKAREVVSKILSEGK
jgi:hypothetical protein